MIVIGNIEWFKYNSQKQDVINRVEFVEKLRNKFLKMFSPKALKSMSGKELLIKVFDNSDNSMMNLLMMNSDYRWFGASSKYSYMSIIYRGADGIWTYFNKNKHVKMSQYEAEQQAVAIRDGIIRCIELIDSSELDSIDGYKDLELKMVNTFESYNYVTILKYFQMIYPFYFPCMYADKTLDRCIQILGLPMLGTSAKFRIRKMGVISLFIRMCDINNIAFNRVYANEWGWDKACKACSAAEENSKLNFYNVKNVNKTYYQLQEIVEINKDIIADIEEALNNINIEGKEREAIVKVRINQSVFRERLMDKYGKCCLCGVMERDFLIASHIKPWSVCADKEKIDVNNGLLLCPNHDKLFDKGYISFDDNGRVMLSDKLHKTDSIFMNINDEMHIDLTAENRKYMGYHRKNVFCND